MCCYSNMSDVKHAAHRHQKGHLKRKINSHARLKCLICPLSFINSDALKYHLALHTSERPYECDFCQKKFIKKCHIIDHIATHLNAKPFKCQNCPRTFNTKGAYMKHKKRAPENHSFTCYNCGKNFSNVKWLDKHVCYSHHSITLDPEVAAQLSEEMLEEYFCLAEEQDGQQTQHALSCYRCFKIFSNEKSLVEHQKEHLGKQIYQCRFCPERFSRADHLGLHLRNHMGSSPYICIKCKRHFISAATLAVHHRKYPGDHSFNCKHCHRWFPSPDRLDKHDCIFKNSSVFNCVCGTALDNWNSLVNHFGLSKVCCSCKKTFPNTTVLVRHISTHTDLKLFRCEKCEGKFKSKSSLMKHCDICPKSDNRKDTVQSNECKLCNECGNFFKNKYSLKSHLNRVHKKDQIGN